MMSLFTSFDLMIYQLALLIFFLIFLIVLNFNWFSSMIMKIFSTLTNELLKFFYTLKPNSFSKSFSFWIFISFFCLIMFNFFSVWPFVFAPTSQMSLVLFLSLFFWVSMMIFSSLNNKDYFLAHSVPEGTPIYLTWFLFLIEVVSNVIRPITLTVRLVANILAGHLLMILLSKLVLNFNTVMILYLGLNLVELFVALIQSYIFCTMVCLYFSEVH